MGLYLYVGTLVTSPNLADVSDLAAGYGTRAQKSTAFSPDEVISYRQLLELICRGTAGTISMKGDVL